MSLETVSGIANSIRRNEDFTSGEQRWFADFFAASPLTVCAAPTACLWSSSKEIKESSGSSLEKDTKHVQVGSKSPVCECIVLSQTGPSTATMHPKSEGEHSICRSTVCIRKYWCHKAKEKDFFQNLMRCLVLSLCAFLRKKELPLTSLWCSLLICKMKTVLAL